MQNSKQSMEIKKITITAVMSAVGAVLMFLEIALPIMPSFIKFDFSELPALITSFVVGPLGGAAVCFIKNLIHLFITYTPSTFGIGELSNFLLGCCFVIPAGLIYKHKKTFSSAVCGTLAGAAIMAVISIFSNYFIVYPIYTGFMPMEAIIGMYKAINPNVNNLWDCLIMFNLPFTFIKGVISAVLTLLVYKPIINVLKLKDN